MAEEHQWVVVAVYELSREDIARQSESGERVGLTGERLVGIEGPGCYRCEMTWAEGKDKPCDGGERITHGDFTAQPAEGGVNVDRNPRG